MSDAQPPVDPYQPGPYQPYQQPQYGAPPPPPDTIQFGSQPAPPGPPPGYPPQQGYPAQAGYPAQPGFQPHPGYQGYPQPGYPPFAEAAPRKRSRTPIFIAIGLVVSLVLGGGAVAGAWVWYGWGGTQPESVLPGSVSVFARVDLSPGLNQKLKIDNLAKKFPKDEQTTQDFVEKLERDMLKSLGLEKLNYDADIKPWFDERIGLAAWGGKKGEEPCGLVALASKDDGKAAAALTKVRTDKGDDHFGFAFKDGYAVIAECSDDAQVTADAAVAEAKSQSLAKNTAFAREVSALPGGQTLLAWVDLDKLVDQMGGLEGLFGRGGDTDLGALNEQLKGHFVIGALATNDGLDVRFRLANGSTAPAGIKDVSKDLDALPGNSAIAAAVHLNAGTDTMDQVEKALRLDESELGPDADRINDGIRALLGSVLTMSMTEFDEDSPTLQLIARAASADSANKLADLAELLEEDAGEELAVEQQGNSVKVTVGSFSGNGRLGDVSLYKEAMGGADGTSIAAVYVDVQKVAAAMGPDSDADRYINPVKAVGFSTGYDGNTAVGLLRIVIK